MIQSTITWRSHTETPAAIGETAIIAVPPTEDEDPDDGALLLFGIYSWDGREWAHEVTDAPPGHAAFWWVAERDLTAPLDGPAAVQPDHLAAPGKMIAKERP